MLREIGQAWPALGVALARQGTPLPLAALSCCRVHSERTVLADPDVLYRELLAWLGSDPPLAGWLRCQSSFHVHVAHAPFVPRTWEGVPLYGELAWPRRSVRFRPNGHGGIALVRVEDVEEGGGEEVLAHERRVRAAREELGRAVYRLYWKVDDDGLVRLAAWRLLGFEREGTGG